MDKFAKAANDLMRARLSRKRLPTLPAEVFPADLNEAYAIQDQLISRLLSHHGGQPGGFKIACTNEAAQRFLHLAGPFYGPLLSELTHDSPARLNADDFFMRVIEPEFAFEMAQDLPARNAPYSQAEVTEATGDLRPAIEIVESRYEDWTTVGAACLIADHAVHGAFVPGRATSAWREIDLAQHEVHLWVNDELNQTGRGAVVLGHPLTALTWLANALSQRGHGLQAGQIVTTGVCVDQVYNARPGDVVRADFGVLGVVEVRFDHAGSVEDNEGGRSRP